jgi:hypothetical protein
MAGSDKTPTDAELIASGKNIIDVIMGTKSPDLYDQFIKGNENSFLIFLAQCFIALYDRFDELKITDGEHNDVLCAGLFYRIISTYLTYKKIVNLNPLYTIDLIASWEKTSHVLKEKINKNIAKINGELNSSDWLNCTRTVMNDALDYKREPRKISRLERLIPDIIKGDTDNCWLLQNIVYTRK